VNTIELARQDALFTLTMRDGENRFTLPSLRALQDRLDEIVAQAGDGPAALIVTAEGKYWSNGIDLEALGGSAPEEQAAFLPALHAVLGRLASFPLPTVAALSGHCFAGGAILALAFDYRVMRTGRGWFCLPEVDIGIPFTEPMLALLRAKLRPETLRDAVLSGRRYAADAALAAGIVDATCELEQLGARAAELVGPLADKPRDTFARFKRDLYGDLARELGFEA
jgi:enoyl-CoA hydratase/carnithine racemase